MATIKKFEDLDSWKLSRELAKRIFEVSSQGKFATDYKHRDQINNAAGSIMDNIAEGFERASRDEFVNFLSYSKGSAGEVRSQTHRAFDKKYFSAEVYKELILMAENTSGKIANLIGYLNKSAIKGTKFKDRKNIKA